MDLGQRGYDITVQRGSLAEAGRLLDLKRKVLIVTDEGVPATYAEAVAAACDKPLTVTVPRGEGSKSLAGLERLLTAMLDAGFTRGDCVCAVGGGVPGDLAGFAASAYMRGIDFYNIPTTLLSQVDSSIGGKTAVNLGGVKNIVGAFWQPRAVLIDPDTLKTLPAREYAGGMAEAVKTALIGDAALFDLLEAGQAETEDVIARSLAVKKAVVEADEREGGARKALNFGHSIGHAIESATGLPHGACVALGMLPMCSDAVRARLLPVLEKAGLPTSADFDRAAVWEAMRHDKKAGAGSTDIVTVEEIGHGQLERVPTEQLKARFDLAYPEV
jgi:3-dehydroquinate synthase